VRESFIHHIESDDENDRAFFETFPEYGLNQLPDIQADLDQLYRLCTGQELKQFRVR